MRIVWMLVFAAMMAYVAWWLIGAIRKRIVFEVEMALGVGSLWAAIFVPKFFDLPGLVPWPVALSLAGYVLLWLGIGLFVVTILSLQRGGKPTSGWSPATGSASPSSWAPPAAAHGASGCTPLAGSALVPSWSSAPR